MAQKGRKTRVASDKSDIVGRIPKACTDEAAAVDFIEEMRGWRKHPACPRCQSANIYKITKRDSDEREKHYRWRCRDCKRMYSARTATVFEDSRIPLQHWCYAFWAACSSKKGVSALQIKRMTGLTYKSALFLMHRIRWAMAEDCNAAEKLSGIVEADHTYIRSKRRYAYGDKRKIRTNRHAPVFALVERGGNVRAMTMPFVTSGNVREIVDQTVNVSESTLVTDDAKPFKRIGLQFKGGHHSVKHSAGEYSRIDDTDPDNDKWINVHTNTIEGFFGLIKRGIMGTFHHVSRRHLHRYLSEFQFRYNTRNVDDGARTAKAIRDSVGKRLRYREPVTA